MTYNHAVKTNRREVKLMLKRILIKGVILFCAHVIKAFGTFFKMLQISVQKRKKKVVHTFPIFLFQCCVNIYLSNLFHDAIVIYMHAWIGSCVRAVHENYDSIVKRCEYNQQVLLLNMKNWFLYNDKLSALYILSV